MTTEEKYCPKCKDRNYLTAFVILYIICLVLFNAVLFTYGEIELVYLFFLVFNLNVYFREVYEK